MDAWIHEAEAFGLKLGDAHVIRNAGGSAQEAVRSLIISQQFLGTDQVMLVKHTRGFSWLRVWYRCADITRMRYDGADKQGDK